MKRVFFALLALMISVSCVGTPSAKSTEESCCSAETKSAKSAKSAEESVVEVLYMHGKQRCVTCVAIGVQSQEVVDELGSDRVVMRTIDFSTAEGEKVADKYEIASSSLIVVKDGKVDNLTAQGFRFAKNSPEQFKSSLRESIKKMLE